MGMPGRGASDLDRPGAEQIARNLRAIADPTRVQILRLIVDSPSGSRPVTELAEQLGLTQPTVSHHLKVLGDEGLLIREQDGRHARFSIAPSHATEVHDAIRSRTEGESPALTPSLTGRIAEDLATRFRGTFSKETVAAYVEESYSLLSERAQITRYLPSLTARFAGDRLRSLSTVSHPTSGAQPEVLFVCVQNAGRSQLASAIMRSLAGERIRVLTAGSEPVREINPLVVAALDEVGIPINGEFPKPLTDEVVRAADYVITMGCGDACPIYPGRRYLDWDLPDPAGMPMAGIRALRDEIDERVRALLDEIDAPTGER